MNADFWHKRWSEGRIGFHQSQANPMLVEHWPTINLGVHIPVFVPLCGKSLDLLWLEQLGHQVTGVELSRSAIEEFDRENRLSGHWSEVEGLALYSAGSLRIWQADFFSLSHKHVAPIQAVFDRAALIALPKEMRARYCKHLQALAADQCQQLLICLEYDQSKRDGPPFAVFSDDIDTLYPQWSKITLASQSVGEKQPPSKDRAYHLTLNA